MFLSKRCFVEPGFVLNPRKYRLRPRFVAYRRPSTCTNKIENDDIVVYQDTISSMYIQATAR